MRHGDAEFRLPDSARQLTAKGKAQVKKMAKTYAQKLHGVELVLTSPLQRALQTTEIFIANAKLDCDIQVVDFLVPKQALNKIERQINTFEHKKIFLVGHLPLLDYWINYLTGNYSVRMATASMASLSMDCAYKGQANLNWVYHVD